MHVRAFFIPIFMEQYIFKKILLYLRSKGKIE
jgi:hypothetical protein